MKALFLLTLNVSDTWIVDGFRLTSERITQEANSMLESALPYSYEHERKATAILLDAPELLPLRKNTAESAAAGPLMREAMAALDTAATAVTAMSPLPDHYLDAQLWGTALTAHNATLEAIKAIRNQIQSLQLALHNPTR